MAVVIRLSITVELDHETGKFAGKDELEEFLRNELESCDPGSVDGVGADGMSTYAVSSWTVDSL